MNLDYRFQARFTDSVEVGPVDGVVRIDNYFDGAMTDGELAGARVRGVDQVAIRADGSVVLDIRETIETERGAISADVRGYAIPRRRRAAAAHAARVRAVQHRGPRVRRLTTRPSSRSTGTVDMAAGTIAVTGRSTAPQLAPA